MWGQNFASKFKLDTSRLKDKLAALRKRNDSLVALNIDDTKHELNLLLDHEEMFWKQRFKNFWLQYGYQNTSFFHIQASEHKKSDCIHVLHDQLGNLIEDHSDYCKGSCQQVEVDPSSDYFSFQSAFVLSRLNTDNVLSAFELIHYMKHKTKGKTAHRFTAVAIIVFIPSQAGDG
ncbi:uncharacterized protein LOC110631485 [Hevea brasiliensis]|uniref:uncharacterized protein LOC110631485 n=1 Tax=Hevea brasiliensis TaxID=3981 RepID=UPI0025FB0D33|nr:uncharacterized protein LOC110631485 [Hevea brasiliensis]